MKVTVTSKRHKLKFYLTIILGALFFVLLGTLLQLVFREELQKHDLNFKDYFLPVFSLGCYVMAVYSVYRYYLNAPNIQIDRNSITFNKEVYSLSELKYIKLTGKQPFPYVMGFPMEGAKLQFESGVTKFLFDDMYANYWELKTFLKQVVVDKKEHMLAESPVLSEREIEAEDYSVYKGAQLTSFRGITLWGFVGFIAWIAVSKKADSDALVFFAVLSSIWFFFHSWLMHFFKVSESFFVVKNHNFFWVSKNYRISNIKEIVFETRPKMPNCLRVITRDFRTNMYPAGTLRDKTWAELKRKLEHQGVKVRSEIYMG